MGITASALGAAIGTGRCFALEEEEEEEKDEDEGKKRLTSD